MKKGNATLIETLNKLLRMERTGIDQYQTHRALANNWQFTTLVAYLDERIGDEREHERKLMDRILFLEGGIVPAVMDAVNVGLVAKPMLLIDQSAEQAAIAAYNEAIALAESVSDFDTATMLRSILADETDHLNDIEARLSQIELMGEQIWLATQIGEAA